jgi:hypothetical protein
MHNVLIQAAAPGAIPSNSRRTFADHLFFLNAAILHSCPDRASRRAPGACGGAGRLTARATAGQVTGTKRVLLWPPSEAHNLYTEGSSSRVPDPLGACPARFPRFARAAPARLEATLRPGDALFIPGLWFHHVSAESFSIAVNVFWKVLAPSSAFQRLPAPSSAF